MAFLLRISLRVSKKLIAYFFFFILAAFSLMQPLHAHDRRGCLVTVSKQLSVYIDSYANDVYVNNLLLRPGSDLLLCPGDRVRTGPTGRVTIKFNDERTVIRLDGNALASIPLTSDQYKKAHISLWSGILYFISSVRRQFKIKTPFLMAGIDGTEAIVLASPRLRLGLTAVRQGTVSAYAVQEGPSSKLYVNQGEVAFVSDKFRFQKAPLNNLPKSIQRLLVVSNSAVDWAVYYPPILLTKAPHKPAIVQAVRLMGSGDYDRAEKVLRTVQRSDPSSVAALRTIIAIGRNRLKEAQYWSEKALKADPQFGPAHIAASYVSQAKGDLRGALSFAATAVKIRKNDAYALARLAELQMTIGDRLTALKTAKQSLAITETPLALFVQGLATLIATDYETAEKLFRKAISLDLEAPLPRLGLGLTFIRKGNIAAGTWELERALAHDPKRAVLRTWLGRAYFEESATVKAADQFDLAKKQDPEDPTPYLFSSFERLTSNQPIAALNDLLEAEKLGPARHTLRSKTGLEADAAARGAAQGRVYDLLKFGQLGRIAGSEGVWNADAEPSAHRFLSDTYRTYIGYGIAQTSEMLKAQLLSPPSLTPVQPHLSEARLAILNPEGPSRVTFAEFSPLFQMDGLRLDGTALAGTQSTRSAEAAITGLHKNISLSIGQFFYETDGYRENNHLKHEVFNAATSIAISPEVTVFGEYRKRESEGGDRRLNFDIDDFSENLTAEEVRDVVNLGFHIKTSVKSDLIGVYSKASLDKAQSTVFPFFTLGISDVQHAEKGQLQYIRNDDHIQSITGASYLLNDIETVSYFNGFPLPNGVDTDAEYYNLYSYLNFDYPANISWTVGGAFVSFSTSNGMIDIQEFHPKLGVSAKLSNNINFRASYLKNMKPNAVLEQTIEPTTVTGFNQFYDTFDGTILEQAGVAVDFKADNKKWFGVEAIWRWWEIPSYTDPFTVERKDQLYRAYLYTTFSDRLSLSTEVLYEKEQSESPFDVDDWRTLSVPVTLSYFDPSGFFGSFGVEYVDHRIVDGGTSQSDTFITASSVLGYRLPDNAGVFSVEVKNLFDTEFNFQNRYIRNNLTAIQRYAPERTILFRGTAKF